MTTTRNFGSGAGFLAAILLFVALFFPDGPVALHGAGTATEWFAGLAVIAGYGWWAHRFSELNLESQDSIYFLGFLMTLLHLVFGLAEIDGPDLSEWIPAFLPELGVALGFSVLGLTARQLVALSVGAPAADGDHTSSGSMVAAAQVTLSDEAIDQLGTRMQEVVSGMADAMRESRNIDEDLEALRASLKGMTDMAWGLGSATQGAQDLLARASKDMAEAASKTISTLIEAQSRLDQKVSELTQDLEQTVKDLKQDVEHIGEDVKESADKIAATSRKVAGELEASKEVVVESVNMTSETWRQQLDQARTDVESFNTEWQREKLASLSNLKTLTTEVSDLAATVRRSVESIPAPGDRLEQIWTTLEEGSARVDASTSAISSSVSDLDRDVKAVRVGLDESATELKAGIVGIRSTLQSEVEEIDQLIGQLCDLLDGNVKRLRKG